MLAGGPEKYIIILLSFIKDGCFFLAMSGYKEETIKAYNQFSEYYDQKFEGHFAERVKDKADEFVALLEPGAKVLDLGSGPGHHALYLQQQGLDVLCVDLSSKMVLRCRQQGLCAIRNDMEDLILPDKFYDGVWSYAALLHVPKVRVDGVIDQIHRVLKPEGVLSISFKEKGGSWEGFVKDEHCPDTMRWFSLYTDQEIRELFSDRFTIVGGGRTPVSESTAFLHYHMRLK